MARIRPLSPGEAKQSLVQRLGRVADRTRQIAVKFGARPYRVVLVWELYPAQVRGEGGPPRTTRELELLPTPKVASLDSVTFSVFHAGTIPAGSIKLSGVSIVCYTYDQLTGHVVPQPDPSGDPTKATDGAHVDQIAQPADFYYEVREDGRGDCPAIRSKYRVLSPPFRDATNCQWTVMLEKVSEDRGRDGVSKYLSGKEG
jgi:hypothetical protein